MRIVSRAALKAFWEQPKYRDSEQPLKAWFDDANTPIGRVLMKLKPCIATLVSLAIIEWCSTYMAINIG
jgi:mRNA-degrading endonuclease HigB of HigAB toxin-antitoxin module